nr:uncharacterized protein LOC105847671 [Hydra vulgaris]
MGKTLLRKVLLVFVSILLLLIMMIRTPVYKQNLTFKRINQTNIMNQDCFRNRFKTTLLIIVYNSPLYKHLKLLQNLYVNGFLNMFFCGPEDATSPSWILKSVTSNGYFTYEECTARIMSIYPNYTGYLVINDDLFLNYLNIKNFNLFQIWEGPLPTKLTDTHSKPIDWYWWNTPWGVNKCFKALEKVRLLNKYVNLQPNLSEAPENGNWLNIVSGKDICYGARADIYYIPVSKAKSFIELSNIFKEESVFLEIAVPTIITFLSNDTLRLNGIYMPDQHNLYKNVLKCYHSDLIFIHPVKMNYGEDSLNNIKFLKSYSHNASVSISC